MLNHGFDDSIEEIEGFAAMRVETRPKTGFIVGFFEIDKTILAKNFFDEMLIHQLITQSVGGFLCNGIALAANFT